MCRIRDGGGNCNGVTLERLLEEVHGFSLFLSMGGRGDFLSLHLGLALELHTLLMSFRRALSNGSVTEANWREPRILSWARREVFGFFKKRRVALAISFLLEGGRDSVWLVRFHLRPSQSKTEAGDSLDFW